MRKEEITATQAAPSTHDMRPGSPIPFYPGVFDIHAREARRRLGLPTTYPDNKSDGPRVGLDNEPLDPMVLGAHITIIGGLAHAFADDLAKTSKGK